MTERMIRDRGDYKMTHMTEEVFWAAVWQGQSRPFQVLTEMIRHTKQYLPLGEVAEVKRPDKLLAILSYLSGYRTELPVEEDVLLDVLEASRKEGDQEPIDLGQIELNRIDYQKLVNAVTALTTKE